MDHLDLRPSPAALAISPRYWNGVRRVMKLKAQRGAEEAMVTLPWSEDAMSPSPSPRRPCRQSRVPRAREDASAEHARVLEQLVRKLRVGFVPGARP